MNYHNITTDDMLNGEGLRTVLWVSGCEHHCFKCQNSQTWDTHSGIQFDDNALNELLENIKKPYISGVTYSGGDPFHPKNVSDITKIAMKIKRRFPNKTQWLYTGYNFDEIQYFYILKYLDVIIDGKYEEEKRDITLPWRGSYNQHIWKKNKDNIWCIADKEF